MHMELFTGTVVTRGGLNCFKVMKQVLDNSCGTIDKAINEFTYKTFQALNSKNMNC